MSKKRMEEEYKKSLAYRFKQWMSGEKDPFIGKLEMAPPTQRKDPERFYDPSEYEEIKKKSRDHARNKRWKGYGKLYTGISIFVCVMVIALLIYAVSYLPSVGSADNPANNEVPQRYIEQGLEETGSVNIVTGMILNYRAFDTFGESTVLFAATCCVMSLLLVNDRGKRKKLRLDDYGMEPGCDVILQKVTRIVCPFIFLFGIYVVLNGHLSPGGGFSGGAIIGAGLIMYSIAFGFEKTERFFTRKTHTWICFGALSFYCLAKSYSFFTGANHLPNVISNGTPGNIISGGLILPLNICVGLVVACTVYSFYSLFRRGGL